MLEEYFCQKCKRPHKKFRGKAGQTSKIFKAHKEFGIYYDKISMFKRKFLMMWRREVKKRKQKDCGYEPYANGICTYYLEHGDCCKTDKKCQNVNVMNVIEG